MAGQAASHDRGMRHLLAGDDRQPPIGPACLVKHASRRIGLVCLTTMSAAPHVALSNPRRLAKLDTMPTQLDCLSGDEGRAFCGLDVSIAST